MSIDRRGALAVLVFVAAFAAFFFWADGATSEQRDALVKYITWVAIPFGSAAAVFAVYEIFRSDR